MRSLLLAGIAAVGLTVGVSGAALAATPASTATGPVASPGRLAPAYPDCPIEVIGSGVNLHTQPTTSSTIVAQLQYGQEYTSPGCTIVYGGSYGPVCGKSFGDNQWDEIYYNGVIRYFVAECGLPGPTD